jgi:cytochrome c553
MRAVAAIACVGMAAAFAHRAIAQPQAAQAQAAGPQAAQPQGAPPKIVDDVCSACHGVDGSPDPSSHYPSLAGQGTAYLERQLHAFAAQGQQRQSGIMGAIAVHLSSDEMRRAATWYATRRPRPARAAAVPKASSSGTRLAAEGERIYFAGIPQQGVDSCASCHGVRAEGLPDLFPRLAGQHADYLAAQLRDFRAQKRTTDPRAMMRRVAWPLSDHDIDAVAQYLAGLR